MKKKAVWKNQIQIRKVKNWKYALEKKGYGKKVYQIKKQKGFKCDSFWILFSLKRFTFFFLRNLFFSEEDFIFLGVPVLLFCNFIFRFAKLFIYFSKTNNSKKRKRGIE